MNEEKAAVYHFTDRSEKRPKICNDQLQALEDYAISLGFSDVDVFCDRSLLRSKHPEFDRFLSCSDQYKALITKDFYHIARNTGKCMSIMRDLRNRGIGIYTMENGTFLWDEPPFDRPLRIASYTSRFGTPNELKEIITVNNDIFTLFTRNKTSWHLEHQYSDESQYQKNEEQIQLQELIKDKDNYDLLLVHNLNNLHRNTSKLCRIREQLQMDIYSLQEGLLKYRKGASA